jgi:osmoprotectant transport system permease protein
MNLDPRFYEALARLPDYLGNHVLVSVTALALGLAISLPLAIVATRRPFLRNTILGFASIVQTIPGLALLALFYPLLLALSGLTQKLFGIGFSALGFLPSVLALALYSMLPVLRNTVTGITGIDPAVKEATLGVGMTERQALTMVELPLALPVIMAGIRTAAVWTIGTATLATPVGQTSLGNYIFTGLQTQNWVFVIFGCVASAILALAVDQLLALMESGVSTRKHGRVWIGGLGIALIVVAALFPVFARPATTYIVGAKTFTEQYILESLIEQRLRAAGLSARVRDGLGSTVIFNALASGEIDAYVEYSGTLWANEMKRTDPEPRETVLAEVKKWLAEKYQIKMLGGLGFENAYALAISRKKANQLGIKSIADLARFAPQMSIAGDYEFFVRPDWKALQKNYGLEFRERKLIQPEFMYQAAASGEVDAISAYTSEGRIKQYDLVVLEDPKHAIPPYDAILLVSPKRANDEKLINALKPLLGSINLDLMREANLRADGKGGKSSPDEIARWMWEKIETGKKP